MLHTAYAALFASNLLSPVAVMLAAKQDLWKQYFPHHKRPSSGNSSAYPGDSEDILRREMYFAREAARRERLRKEDLPCARARSDLSCCGN